MIHNIDDATLEDLYKWIDSIPLSRPKRNIARDFSDGVLIAELIKHFEPKLVEVHNYIPANNTDMKEKNWEVLNRKVFIKSLRFEAGGDVIRNIVTSTQGAIEHFLLLLRTKLEEYAGQKRSIQLTQKSRGRESDKPESDQYLASPKGKGSQFHQGTSRGLHNPVPATKNKGKAVRGMAETNMIPRSVYEEKEQECIAKDETIAILKAKVERMEHLIGLKDVRIQDLSSRLETTRPTGVNKEAPRREPSDRRYYYAK